MGNTKSGRCVDEPDTKAGVVRGLLQVSIFVLVMGATLFIAAGRLDWGMGWVYVGVVALNTLAITLFMDPELIAERAQVQREANRLDLLLAVLMARVGPLATLVVAGLGQRHRWTAVSPASQVAALAVAVLGLLLTDWAMLSNRFFSGIVRIQKDRGHTVVSGGPYQYLRHPGYLGSILWSLATPLMLGSVWALVPGTLTAGVVAVRTALEDRTLRAKLEGYQAYAQRVRHRLLPGVW